MQPYYQRGRVTIYHGDCREILPDLDKVELVLTDPPYARSGNRGEWRVTASVAIGLHLAAKAVAKDGAMLAFSTTSGRGIEFTLSAVGNILPFNRFLTLRNTAARSVAAGPWRWDSIAVLCFGKSTFGMAGESSVHEFDGFDKRWSHRAALPPHVGRWLYKPFHAEGIAVLDPFMGSGALIEDAAFLGATVIGIDTDERYCEMAAQRLAFPSASLDKSA